MHSSPGTREPVPLHNMVERPIFPQHLQCLLAKSHTLGDPQIMQTVSMKDLAVMSKDRFQSHTMPQNREGRTVGETFREIRSQLPQKGDRDLEESLVRELEKNDQRKYWDLVEKHPRILHALVRCGSKAIIRPLVEEWTWRSTCRSV